MIRDFQSFIGALMDAGFSGAVGGKDDGVFALFRYGWGAEVESGVVWHTGDPDTDPWEWRVRVLNERDDIAYAKLFFRKAGYITKEWYPFFLAARRGGMTFEEAYAGGVLSHAARRVYEVFDAGSRLPVQDMKRRAGFSRADAAKFDSALSELQMRMYLTMCGAEQRRSRTGEEYGWQSTVFCKPETFWPCEVFERAAGLTAEAATRVIAEQVMRLNPAANPKKLVRFISG